MNNSTDTIGQAKVTCAISGITFHVSHVGRLHIPVSTGYFHPIFAASYTDLHSLYTAHCKGQLSNTESYLLFLAFMHSTSKIDWSVPCSLNPKDSYTTKYIENNIAQLLETIEKSACIKHPDFHQPNYRMTKDNSNLSTLQGWLESWQHNTQTFVSDKRELRRMQRLQEALSEVEDKLSYLILSGEKPQKCSSIIAQWASKAACFPEDKNEAWQQIIRSCFNADKMFNTPLSDIKEVKEYCEINITAGSIHFHALSEVLREGVKRHTDYLGGSHLALGYKILDVGIDDILNDDDDKLFRYEGHPSQLSPTPTARQVETHLAKPITLPRPPKELPKRSDYKKGTDYLKARLAFKAHLLNNLDTDKGLEL